MVIRLHSGESKLDPANDEFEAAQLLVRLFSALETLFENENASMCTCLSAYNLDLEASSIDSVDNRDGLLAVCQYVDEYIDPA